MILAIETATDVCAVAFKNEQGRRFEKRAEARGSHSEKLFGFISELMQEHGFGINDLNAVLISEGPGSYTGLRIAASGVKGLLFDSDIDLYRVPTTAALATAVLQENSEGNIHAVIDAKRKHLYHQQFKAENQQLVAQTDVEVKPLVWIESQVQHGDILIGTGWNRLSETITGNALCRGTEVISAKALITLFQSPESGYFIHRVEAKNFDPQYYSSSQV